jgi:lipopolysaccharide transport protein LptA
MQRANSPDPTYAEAGRLEYDLSKGIIEFSEQATISENGNQISSSYLVYNIKKQLINAQSGGDGDPKVRIIYTPKEPDAPAASDDDEDTDAIGPEGPGDGGP